MKRRREEWTLEGLAVRKVKLREGKNKIERPVGPDGEQGDTTCTGTTT